MNYIENGIEYSEFIRNGKIFKRKLVRNGTHHMTHSSLYSRWKGIRRRCNNPNAPKYKFYGGKGIKVCKEWDNKENGFENFMNWSLENGYREDLTIDRIDSSKDYCPENCRWITMEENIKRANKGMRLPKYKYTATNKENKLFVTFYRIKDFSERFNLESRRISDCLNGHLDEYEGWLFNRELMDYSKGLTTIPQGSTMEDEFPLEVQSI